MITLLASQATPQEVRRATEEVLIRPEFRSAQGDDLLARIFRWIGGQLTALGDWAGAHPVGAWVLIVLLLLVLAAIIVHIVYTFRRVFARVGTDAADGRRRSASVGEVLEGAAKDYRTAIELAIQAARQGEVRRAVWLGHRVLLGLLDAAGSLAFAAWKTNMHYLAECPTAQTMRPLLASLSEEYDRVVYAHRPGSAAIGRLLEQVRQLCVSGNP